MLPVVSVYVSRCRQVPATAFSDSFSVFVCMVSVALFIAISQFYKNRKISGISSCIISELGPDTLGVYLCHIALMERIPVLREWCDMLPSVIGMMIYSIILFCIGSIISALLRRIPVIGRYIC
jgi:fucose 4-O-acetylase-like acetyltransferase